jgi:DNA-binding response OmpR family regulator
MPKTTNILVVEPDAAFRSRLADELDLHGYQVAVANSPAMAESLTAANEFDLIVGRVDGLGERCMVFFDEMKRRQPDETLFIILADHISSENAINALRMGAADLLTEPIGLNDVIASVRTTLLPKIDRKRAIKMFCCLKTEEREFSFPSNEDALGPAVDLLTENLPRAGVCSQIETRLVAMALAEALTNALYHGNLEIDPRLKFDDGDSFDELARRRLADPRFANRRLTVRYILTPQGVTYVIKDDGPGFKYQGTIADEARTIRDHEKADGRGLYLLSSIMDEVTFNEGGNEIRLVKRSPRPTPSFAELP